jgi:hypothetical protein
MCCSSSKFQIHPSTPTLFGSWPLTSVCLFQGAVSKVWICHSGVPQGSVISTWLFNFFVADFPGHAQLNLSYADDFNLSESSPNLETPGRTLTEHLVHVSEWEKENKLVIAPAKLFVTLFTPWTKKANSVQAVFFEGTQLPLNTLPKTLGLTLGTLFKNSSHTSTLCPKLAKRQQLLKATSGQDFGDKETLSLTYKTFMKPVIDYIAPVYFPSMDPDSVAIEALQKYQNAAMCTITGTHKMTPIDHLHAETSLLPVKAHF